MIFRIIILQIIIFGIYMSTTTTRMEMEWMISDVISTNHRKDELRWGMSGFSNWKCA